MTNPDAAVFPLYPNTASSHSAGSEHTQTMSDEELLALYAFPERKERCVRANFVTSLDGSVSINGLSGGLGNPADQRILALLRRMSDVVLVGAETVRREGYGALSLGKDSVRWRKKNNLTSQPSFALVSQRLDLDEHSDIFLTAETRPLVLTVSTAPTERIKALSAVAEVVRCGESSIDPHLLITELTDRGHNHILCEGGPRLFATLLAAGMIDELCLSLSPLFVAGFGARMSASMQTEIAQKMTLKHVVMSHDMLLSRYSRKRTES